MTTLTNCRPRQLLYCTVTACLLCMYGCGRSESDPSGGATAPAAATANNTYSLAERPVQYFPGDDVLAQSLNKAQALYEDTQFNEVLLLCRELSANYGQDPRRDEIARLIMLAREARRDESQLRNAINQLGSSSSASVAAAKDVLIQSGQLAPLFLRKHVRDGSGESAQQALNMLVEIRDAATPGMLVELLQNSDDPYRQGAYVAAIGRLANQLQTPEALVLLEIALTREPFRYRKATFTAVATAAKQPGVSIHAEIKAAMDKAQPVLRADIIQYLADVKDADAPTLALQLLGGKLDNSTRQALISVLTGISNLSGSELTAMLALVAADNDFSARGLAEILAKTAASRCNNDADQFNSLLGRDDAYRKLASYIAAAADAENQEIRRWGNLYQNMFLIK